MPTWLIIVLAVIFLTPIVVPLIIVTLSLFFDAVPGPQIGNNTHPPDKVVCGSSGPHCNSGNGSGCSGGCGGD